MELNDILSSAEDQDRGAWLDLVEPVTGKLTGIRLRIAGPDSATQRRSSLALVDELTEMAAPDGTVSAETREKARLNNLARCVLGWEITEDGKPIPFSHANVLRLLRAARWVQEQVDSFAGSRAQFREGR